MKLSIMMGDITEHKADALIYSTNASFLLSGGVGKALLNRFGIELQHGLDRSVRDQISGNPRVGSVVSCKLPSMPWKLVLHTVVTDINYNTDPEVLKKVLVNAIDVCDQTHGIYTIAVSALGCGFGDLTHSKFINILSDSINQYNETDLKEIFVVCDNKEYFDQMCFALVRANEC